MPRLSRLTLAVVMCGLALRCGGDPLAPPPLADDPIAHEVRAWQAQLADASRTDDLWMQLKPGVSAALETAARAVAAGRRWSALERLAAARANLVAAQYVSALPAAARRNVPGFETEWTRMGGVLGAANAVPQTGAFARVQPAAARALAEASAFQVKVLYDASVLYGRATDADSGLFYLGSAQAQQEFVTFAQGLSSGRGARQPALRAITQDTDALEAALLALYRPPVSIDRHPEFIAANSALKEAKELDAAGLRYGAMQRYLLAVMRVALLRQSSPADAAAVRARLQTVEPRLVARGVDHTIGRMYLERAFTELDAPAPTPLGLSIAAAVADEVLPKYFAALDPAPAAPAPGAPRVTVTLVRWPFT
jgi:hypothetical protein